MHKQIRFLLAKFADTYGVELLVDFLNDWLFDHLPGYYRIEQVATEQDLVEKGDNHAIL